MGLLEQVSLRKKEGKWKFSRISHAINIVYLPKKIIIPRENVMERKKNSASD